MRHTSAYICLFLLGMLMASCHKVRHDHEVMALKGNYTYRGDVANKKYDGYGQLTHGDSIVYTGQWKDGKREGQGICTDSLGRRIVGQWRADTLVSGTRTDSLGTYRGDFNRRMVASGHGIYTDKKGHIYEGYWRNDRRTGFGFALEPGRHLRLGEWKADNYLGERVEYSSDRIYGIDISRFQHDIGRKHYAIDWGRMRITHLGSISKKHVRGTVDYPVSFCYIKSTEGVTLRNRYYLKDYQQARSHGIHCGSYHFFSINSAATAQANFFVKHSRFLTGDFPPVLDLEPLPSQIAKIGGVEVLFSRVRTWMRLVRQHTGVRPVLYVNQTFVNRYLPSAPDIKRDYEVWIARYGEYKPDVRLIYWQLCPDGRVAGIHGQVDVNVFNGYRNEYREFFGTQRIK